MARVLNKWIMGAAAGVAAGLAVRAAIRGRRYFDLRDRVVLVTGGSRGLGLALARQLVEQDARIAICARDEPELRRAREELEGRAARAVFATVCDVTDREQARSLVDQVRSEMGPIDVLINNAGVITVGPFDTINEGEFRQAFATHVAGPLELIRAVLPDMRRRGGGRIVNISSIGGKVPVPHMAAYTASKHALAGLSGALRAELARENIHVTLVCPGLMRTGSPLHARFKGRPHAEYAWFAFLDNLPLISIDPGRMAARIIDAMVHGDAELVTPMTAKLAAKFHGAFSGLSTELAALQARLLPQGHDVGASDRPLTGREADAGQLPAPLERRQARSAARFNEV